MAKLGLTLPLSLMTFFRTKLSSESIDLTMLWCLMLILLVFFKNVRIESLSRADVSNGYFINLLFFRTNQSKKIFSPVILMSLMIILLFIGQINLFCCLSGQINTFCCLLGQINTFCCLSRQINTFCCLSGQINTFCFLSGQSTHFVVY